MSIAALVRRMGEAGASVEAIALAVEAIEAKEAELEARRAKERERKARQRAGQSRDSHGTVTGLSGDTPLPDKESPPAPPKEINPPPDSPPSGAVASAEIDAAIEAYSLMAREAGLAVPRAITASRRARIASTLREHGMGTWLEAVAKVGASAFCRGVNDRGWKADLDFLLQPKSYPKILEGHYDDRPTARAGPSVIPLKDTAANAARRRLEAIRNERFSGSGAAVDDHQPATGLLPFLGGRAGG